MDHLRESDENSRVQGIQDKRVQDCKVLLYTTVEVMGKTLHLLSVCLFVAAVCHLQLKVISMK